jgi:hypothetical protein
MTTRPKPNVKEKERPLSPLEAKKKKLIQSIRTLLNDYPDMQRMAQDLYTTATFSVLRDFHLNLMGRDNPSSLKRTNQQQEEKEKEEHTLAALQRALRLREKRALAEDEKSKELALARKAKEEEMEMQIS